MLCSTLVVAVALTVWNLSSLRLAEDYINGIEFTQRGQEEKLDKDWLSYLIINLAAELIINMTVGIIFREW